MPVASSACPSAPAARAWTAWTTDVQVTVTDPDALDHAVAVTRARIEAVGAAASRFEPDSEVSRLAHARTGRVVVSPLLAELVTVALAAAERTDGAVDPTLGHDLLALGYDGGPGHDDEPGHDDDPVPDPEPAPARATGGGVSVRRATGWRDVVLDGRRLRVPAGTLLDLGATAKAWTADRCAADIAASAGCGVLVALGGDVRAAGDPPDGGWIVRVSDGPDEPVSDVRLAGLAALATSSTRHRTWRTGARVWHHILDPGSGRSAPETWRTVTVAAPTCVEANTLTTAAVVRGPGGLDLLRESGWPARLVAADRSVVTCGGWPA